MGSVFATILGVFIGDKFLLPQIAPRFRIQKFRLPVWCFKYLALPLIAFGATTQYFEKENRSEMKYLVDKYHFSFEDFKKINERL